MISTDYTRKATGDSLAGAPLNRYRFSNWLLDILKNFMSDPINLRDERICRLLRIQDGKLPDETWSLFRVELPYTTDTRKACTTPAIMVSAGAMEYPVRPVNVIAGLPTCGIGAVPARGGAVMRKLGATIAVVTESCNGTQLLAGLIEDFLVVNSQNFTRDGFLSNFVVNGSSEARRIGIGEAANAKDIYQIVISVSGIGGISWTTDSQGPVYRGASSSEASR